MHTFFDAAETAVELVENPDGPSFWWHSAPLPDGRRIKGAHEDLNRQLKMWKALGIGAADVDNKAVLDIGANDGFFSVAASLCGAQVMSVNTGDWITWPKNISYLSRQWETELEIVTADFRTHLFRQRFDVILFLGVIYHLENVFDCMKRLKSLLNPGGLIFIETHLTQLGNGLPVWEAASDIYPTSAPQGKTSVDLPGISNYLLPNVEAVIGLADTYGLSCQPLLQNEYCQEDPTRGVFRIGHL